LLYLYKMGWSGEFKIGFVVCQGSVLSPFLFAVYMYIENIGNLCKPESGLYTIYCVLMTLSY